jgi:uncharacterized protein YybS (DUF2232 family)
LVSRKATVGLIRASALASALFLAGGAIPFVGPIAMLLAPAPVIIYAVRRSAALSRAIGSVVLAALAVLIAGGPLAFLAYTVSFGLGTVAMSYMLEREVRFELNVAVTTALVLAAGTIAALAMTGSPQALADAVHSTLSAAASRSEALYKAVGLTSMIGPTKAREHLVDLTVRLSPALAAITVALAALANMAVFWWMAGQRRLSYSLFGDLARWSAPQWLIWLFIATGFALFAPLRPARAAALDGFVFVAAVYFCQGLAVMAYYLRVLATPVAWRGLVYFLVIVQPIIAALVSAVGVFDLWVDFRRLKPRDREAGGLGDFL